MVRLKFDYNLHPVLGSCVFLGLAKIRMNQSRSTWVISNQKHMSEGIPLLMLWKSHTYAGYLGYFLNMCTSEIHTNEIRRSKDLVLKEPFSFRDKMYLHICRKLFSQSYTKIQTIQCARINNKNNKILAPELLCSF